ncbi:efflux RND transporter periplasmic adaptor subunit [Vibrio sp. 404]|uniref:Efflux RND transporter periplasmic adaptor subunit n=1 Tax=Vibrio marinisediminis TaxID=2758441 RepID=A0A7W2FUD2_9VIBR|nr:efflux RND transporter periplasmic adaptor subunit [Vibrio marinisediminis]MBA5764402.1 efflux RND transporter periplasmic adaptor subunit [Vibrio marinisediminis]
MNYRKWVETNIARVVVISGIALFIAGCNQANSEETEFVVKPVKLFEVPDSAAQQYDSFIAEIDATERATLSFQVSGEIELIKVKMGQQVEKGELLSQLDPLDYQLAVNAKNAEYELALTAYERAQALFAKKLISADVFDQRETQYKASKAALAQAKTDLAYTQIKAPFDGVISFSHVQEHQVVTTNQPVLNLINNSVMDVVFNIPVSYIDQYGLDRIANASPSVTMDTHKQAQIPARFKEISTTADRDINSYRASVTIARPLDQNLFSGMTGQVHLVKPESKEGVDIVESAWVSKSNEHGALYRFSSETHTLSTIHVDLNSQGKVIRGLKAGDLIVETGVDQLTEGQQVKAWVKEEGI